MIDSGSHINAAVHLRRTERPEGARCTVRCNGVFGGRYVAMLMTPLVVSRVVWE